MSSGRQRLFDELAGRSFWLFDIPKSENGRPDGLTLLPTIAFTACTLPELTVTTEDIKSGTSNFTLKAITGAEVAPITLSRGVTIWDSDFYRWTRNAIKGYSPANVLGETSVPVARRDVLLVWFHDGVKADLPFGPLNNIPAKAFYLKDSIPVRYKPGSDLDADSSERSVQELDLAFRFFTEISLAS